MKNILFFLFFTSINTIYITPINNILANENVFLNTELIFNGTLNAYDDIILISKNILFEENFIINTNSTTVLLKNISIDTSDLNQFLVLNNKQEVQTISSNQTNQYNSLSLNTISSPEETDLIFDTSNLNNQIIINNENGTLFCNSEISISQLDTSTINNDINANAKTTIENISCKNYQSTNSKTIVNAPLEINSSNQFSCNLIKSDTNYLGNIICQGSLNFNIDSIITNTGKASLFINPLEQYTENFLVLDKENRLSITNTYPLNIKTSTVNSSNNILTIQNLNEIRSNNITFNADNLEISCLNENNLTIEGNNNLIEFNNMTVDKEIFFNNIEGGIFLWLSNYNDPNIAVDAIINKDNLPIDFYFHVGDPTMKGNYTIYFSGNSNIFNNVMATSLYLNFLVTEPPSTNSFALIKKKSVFAEDTQKIKRGLDIVNLYKNIETLKKNLSAEIASYKKLTEKNQILIAKEQDIDELITIIKNNQKTMITRNQDLSEAINLFLLEYGKL
jgi:hypothetical protein